MRHIVHCRVYYLWRASNRQQCVYYQTVNTKLIEYYKFPWAPMFCTRTNFYREYEKVIFFEGVPTLRRTKHLDLRFYPLLKINDLR